MASPPSPDIHLLRQHVDFLAAQPRPAGSAAHRQARAYVAEQLAKAGFDVGEVGHGTPALNLVTRPVPDNDNLPLLILGAHYDSIPNSPGADDNASAVAALLELARCIAARLDAKACTARLQLVAYDLEELGMLGSQGHAETLHRDGTAVAGMISLEMLGFTSHEPGSQNLPQPLVGLYPDVGNFIGMVANEISTELLRTATAQMKAVAGLPVESMVVPANGLPLPESRLSDHSPFWDLGFPALMITDTAFYRNPHYHRPSDTPDTLDYPFLAKVAQGVLNAVVALLCGTYPTCPR